jgi:hypothetical protein
VRFSRNHVSSPPLDKKQQKSLDSVDRGGDELCANIALAKRFLDEVLQRSILFSSLREVCAFLSHC